MHDKSSLSHFIENVASSNLETFHSKAIVWLLNTIEDSNHKIFNDIRKNCNVPVGAQHIKSIAEFNSHDLISLFQAEDKYHLVFWENKIKADFHFKRIDSSKLKKIKDEEYSEKLKRIENYQNAINRGFSQPYYYQLRHHLNLALKGNTWLEKFFKSLGIKKKIREDRVDYHWLIISPHSKDDLEKYHFGTWHGYTINKAHKHLLVGDKNFVMNLNFSGYSEWKFITYQSLFMDLKSDLTEIQGAYVAYARGSKVFKNSYSEGLWTLEDLKLIHKELEKSKTSCTYKWNITGSANAPNPLLNICFSLSKFIGKQPNSTLPEFQKILKYTKIAGSKIQNTEVDRITCNIQLQGKAIKIQFSHWDYDNVTLARKHAERGLEYAKAIFQFITPESNIIDASCLKKALIKWLDPYRIDISRINFPTTKTGLSFSLEEKKKYKIDQVLELCEALEHLTKSNS